MVICFECGTRILAEEAIPQEYERVVWEKGRQVIRKSIIFFCQECIKIQEAEYGNGINSKNK